MPLPAGARVGAYEVLSLIGAGGMGEVYRARDTRLHRDVALKILPELFALDPDRLTRFAREAELLASLNHPNIAAIYGVEESETPAASGPAGVRALVLELVEGPTLADRIAQGPLPADEALPIASQICEALQAAHAQGIIHRDLKPANIKLRPDGAVKVLDFGLGKALSGEGSPDPGNSPTISLAATRAGVILGTAAYMSPEQAKGRVADKQSDVWAFGCVLYEMLTGRRAFEGEDASDTLAAVLRGDPDWNALPPDVPVSIRVLMRRCLEKDRKRRIAEIAVAQFVLTEPASLAPVSGAPAAAGAAARRPLWKRAVPTGVALLSAVVAGGTVWTLKPSAPPPPVARFAFPLPEGQRLAPVQPVAMSRDGTRMVYAADNQLYLRSIFDLEPKSIPGTESRQVLTDPVFSPDGQSIVFWSLADGALKRISISGGTAVTICPADLPFGVSWGADGIVFGQGDKGIMRVSPNGGTPERLVTVNDGELAQRPEMLPGGQAVLFTMGTGTTLDQWDRAEVVVHSLDTGARRVLIKGGSDARYVPTGHIVYAVGGTIFSVPFDLRGLRVNSGPVPIIEGVRRGGFAGTASFSFSDTGALFYIPGPIAASGTRRTLVLADQKGTSELLRIPPGAYEHPRVSPDGKRIAFGTDDGKEAMVWIYDLAGTSAMRRLTFGGRNRFPIWSADGQRIAFQSDREGDLGIFIQRADGAGTAERLTKAEQGTAHVPESWSPNGNALLFSVESDSNAALWVFSMRDKRAEPFGDVRSMLPITAAFSPDGRWVAYHSNETGTDAVYVQPFPATGAKYQVAKNDAAQVDHHPVWSLDGKRLFYIPTSGALVAVSVTAEPNFSFGNPVPVPRKFTELGSQLYVRNYDITPDGRIIGLAAADASDSAALSVEFRVVLNWFEELKQRVPSR